MARPNIYKYEFPNGQVYIGQNNGDYDRHSNHKQNSEDIVMIGGVLFGKCNKSKAFYEHIRLYGMPEKQIIEECDLYDLNEREKYWIQHYKQVSLNGTGVVHKVYRGKKMVINLATLDITPCATNSAVEQLTGMPSRRVSDLIKNVMPAYKTTDGNSWVICREDEVDFYIELISQHLDKFNLHTVSQKQTNNNSDTPKLLF